MNGFGSYRGGMGVMLRLCTCSGTKLCCVVSTGRTILCDGKYSELIVAGGALNGCAVLGRGSELIEAI